MDSIRPKVIIISGNAEHGKDELAKILQEKYEEDGKRVFTVAYGDYLKFIAAKYFDWNGKKDEKGRGLLQHLGTEVVRERNPNFWTTIVKMLVDVFHDSFDIFLITDARFYNEIFVFALDGYNVSTVLVERPGHENSLTEKQRNHKSETELKDFKFEYIIKSNTLEELEEKTDKLYERLEKE